MPGYPAWISFFDQKKGVRSWYCPPNHRTTLRVGLGMIASGGGYNSPPIDYFRMFYNDTAIYGSTAGLMCAYAFCGADHLVFATDFRYGSQFGERYARQTVESMEEMDISDLEKKKIFVDNARRLLRLPV